MNSLIYGYYVCKRMWKKLLFRPIHLVVSFVQPIFWLTIFGSLFAAKIEFVEGNYMAYLLPGVCAMTVLQSSAQSGILFVKDFQSDFFGRYNFSQQSKFSILFYKIFADFTRIIAQVFLIYLLGYLMGIDGMRLSPIGILSIVGATFLFTVFYASISCFIAVRTKVPEMMATFIHLLNLPIVFTSTALVPNKNLPDWLSSFAQYNPLSHLSNLLRDNMINYNFGINLSGPSWLILIILSTLAFTITLFYLKTIKYD